MTAFRTKGQEILTNLHWLSHSFSHKYITEIKKSKKAAFGVKNRLIHIEHIVRKTFKKGNIVRESVMPGPLNLHAGS